MFRFKTFYPYIGGKKLSLNYYSILYPQLEKSWKKLVEYLEKENIEYRKDLHNLEITIKDEEKAVKTLSLIHRSFMDVKGYYQGEVIDRRIFHKHLWKKYIPEMINALEKLAENIRMGNHSEAYKIACKMLDIIAETEIKHAMTGGEINRTIFEMLHGNIPQTFVNTYTLVINGAKSVEKIAPRIYELIAEDSLKIAMVLKMNKKMVDRVEAHRTSIEESEEEMDT